MIRKSHLIMCTLQLCSIKEQKTCLSLATGIHFIYLTVRMTRLFVTFKSIISLFCHFWINYFPSVNQLSPFLSLLNQLPTFFVTFESIASLFCLFDNYLPFLNQLPPFFPGIFASITFHVCPVFSIISLYFLSDKTHMHVYQ